MTAIVTNCGEQSVRAVWDARLQDYRLARILYDANAGFGPLDVASRAHEEVLQRLALEHGSIERAKALPEGASSLNRVWRSATAAEEWNTEHLLEPLWEAARQVVRTPAPDVEALQTKLEIIKFEEVWNDGHMDEDCFKIVQADVASISGRAS